MRVHDSNRAVKGLENMLKLITILIHVIIYVDMTDLLFAKKRYDRFIPNVTNFVDQA